MNNGKICVSICAETADEMIRKIARAEECADVIELRFDCLHTSEIKPLLTNLPATDKTFLFTFRPSDQGGKRVLTITERVRFWANVLNARRNDFMVDVECDPALLLAIDPKQIRRIVSHHDFDGRTENVNLTWEVMTALTDGIAKVAVKTHDITDCIPVWKLLDKANSDNRQVIPIAMGEAGKWTRILGLAHGAFMTYGSLDRGDETAPGQLTGSDLVEIYRVKELDKITEVYGVIGSPVTSSLSPYIHNPAFASAGLNAVFVRLTVENLDAFMRRMVSEATREIELNFRGFAVTMPHKQAIIKYLDDIDPTAASIGAVNTVKIASDGRLIGYNTDAHGFIEPLRQRFGGELNDARVAVLGAGGAARACVFALKHQSCDVTVFARDGGRARVLADQWDVHSSALSDLGPPDFDIIVNATSVGMRGVNENESLLNASELTGVKFVYDLVTAPTDTPFIREAKAAGVPAIGGLEMLIAQAEKQFEIWTGQLADVELMRTSAMKHLR